MGIYGRVWDGKMNKGLAFGSNLDHHVDCPIGIWPLLNNLCGF